MMDDDGWLPDEVIDVIIAFENSEIMDQILVETGGKLTEAEYEDLWNEKFEHMIWHTEMLPWLVTQVEAAAPDQIKDLDAFLALKLRTGQGMIDPELIAMAIADVRPLLA